MFSSDTNLKRLSSFESQFRFNFKMLKIESIDIVFHALLDSGSKDFTTIVVCITIF